MKIYKDRPVLFFTHLMTAGLLTGIFLGKGGQYRRLITDYGILHRENIYLKKSRQEILRRQQHLRSIRHEMKNDYILEMAYLEKKLYKQLAEHYRKKTEYAKSQKNLVHTGSVGMDAILNHKRETASKDQIHIDVKYKSLGHVRIDHHDLNALLGNLLDNAIEAVRKLKPGERQISLTIHADSTTLFLEVSNKYSGGLQKDGQGNYLTQKADHYFHGLGLLKVRGIAHKYGGHVTISDEGHIFHVKVLLYMPEK